MTVLHQTEVDGVRCFWVESGRPTLAARLVFRYGITDEPMIESGWQHLLEHLALEGRGGGALQVNGAISLLHTTFDVHGPVEAVVDHLAILSEWLSMPRLDRMTHEVKVLRAEAALRQGNVMSEALLWRYGARGPGLAAYQSPATGRATPDALIERANRVLTRENAAIVLDGPPPERLRLTLPSGHLLPTPEAIPCVPARPAAYVEPRGLVLSGVVRRSPQMSLGHDLLRQALEDELRTGAGAAYAPWASYEPVDAERAVVVAASDVSRELMGTIVNRTLQLVRRLRTYEPQAASLEALQAARAQQLQDPMALMGMACANATLVLEGRSPREVQEWVDEVRAVSGAQVREGWEEFHSSLLFGVPAEAIWDDPLPMLRPHGSTTEVRGRRHRNINWPADKTTLRVNHEGVELRAGKEDRTIPISTLAGVFAYEDGVRHVVQLDGFGLSVDPREWHGGRRAVETLDRVVPHALVMPQPPSERPPPARIGAIRRWTSPLRPRIDRAALRSLLLVLLGMVVIVGGIAATVTMHTPAIALAGFVAGVALIRGATE
jgi:hypothetical protein